MATGIRPRVLLTDFVYTAVIMASEAVRVVAKVTAQHGKVEDLKAILLGLIGPTRTEKGCVSYHLLQNKTDESDFVFG